MSEIPKEIIDFTGIEADSLDKFKEEFQSKYIRKDSVFKDKEIWEKISGNVFGKQETALKQMFKSEGIEFTEDDLMGVKKNEDLILTALNKVKGGYAVQIADLNKKQGQGSEEAVKEYQEKLDKLNRKLSETDAAWKATAGQFESYKAETATKMKDSQINIMLGEHKKQLKIKSDINPAEKAGLEATLKERLKYELDESANDLITMDFKGNRLTSKVKAGDFASPIEAMQDVVNELGLGEKNPHAGKPAPANLFTAKKPAPASNGTETYTGPRVHPKAMR